MIKDPIAANEIKSSWQGVHTLKAKLSVAITGSVAQGGIFAIFVADAAHNLPFIHACSVLNDALQQLSKEGHFKCDSIFLGKLVKSSKKHLSWNDFALINELVAKRNDIAHGGKILPRADCWRYIDAIENELVSWNVVTN